MSMGGQTALLFRPREVQLPRHGKMSISSSRFLGIDSVTTHTAAGSVFRQSDP